MESDADVDIDIDINIDIDKSLKWGSGIVLIVGYYFRVSRKSTRMEVWKGRNSMKIVISRSLGGSWGASEGSWLNFSEIVARIEAKMSAS